MPAKQTYFNNLWLNKDIHPELSSWLDIVKETNKEAYCIVCNKKFGLHNMGQRALTTHMKSKRHSDLVMAKEFQPCISSFLQEGKSMDSSDKDKSYSLPELEDKRNSTYFVVCKDDVIRAEIIWALKTVKNKMSLNSTIGLGETFKMMFPDSSIATQFQLGKTKCSYYINHGLSPYFANSLLDRLKSSNDYVICFDESLNKVAQKGQMDIFVRYFNCATNRLSTEYFNSSFLGRATAEDILDKFNEGITPLPRKNILQVSMDGPNVNLSFLRKLNASMEYESPNGKHLINIGVCGLHVINGAVKTGLQAVKWDLHMFLRDIYYILNDSPARRAEYSVINDGSVLFPQKYCAVRWVENVSCIERALNIYEKIKKFVEKTKLPKTKPCENVKRCIEDIFQKCKLSFFQVISAECEPFLRRFQSSKPLAPFLYSSLLGLIRNLMKRCVKPEIMSKATTSKNLLDINLDQADNLIEAGKVDVGFKANKYLKEIERQTSEKNILLFKHQCLKILLACIQKIKERSPLQFKLVRGLSCFDPAVIVYHPSTGKHRMQIVLEILYESNRISDMVAEKAKTQYDMLCNEVTGKFKNVFEIYEHKPLDEIGLDELYAEVMASDERYTELWQVLKLCLIFSHGNASVESGFSINKSMLVENQLETSLIAQRRVHNAIVVHGGVTKMQIKKDMIVSVRAARKRYDHYLEVEKQKSIAKGTANESEKKKIAEELKKLEEEKKNINMKRQLELDEISSKLQLLRRKKLC